MDFGTVSTIIFYAFLFTFIAQIVFLVQFKKEHKSKQWSAFLGLTIAAYIFAFLSYLILAGVAVDLGTAVGTIMMAGGIAAINTIMLIVGLILRATQKSKIPPAEKQLHAPTFFLSGFILIAVGLGATAIIPTTLQKGTDAKGEQVAIDYLNKKYGNHSYRIVSVETTYGHNGMWDKTPDGYAYSVSSDATKETFYIVINNDFSIRADYLQEVYYTEQSNFSPNCSLSAYNYPYCRSDEFDEYIDNRLIQEYSLPAPEYTYKHYFTSSIISDDLGRIPTIDEFIKILADYYAKHPLN